MLGRCGGIVRGSDVGQEIVSVDALGGVVRLGRWVGTDRPHPPGRHPAVRNSPVRWAKDAADPSHPSLRAHRPDPHRQNNQIA
jgi:hypothetical protein